MSAYRTPNLITPPREEEEVYPYRQAWQSVGLEVAILLSVTSAVFLLISFFGIRFPQSLHTPINLALALLPGLLWMIFSLLRERTVPEPRPRLLLVFVLSGLVANAVGIPLVEDFMKPQEWLSSQSVVNRILGYSFTVGITQEFLKYIILRYTVWPDFFRVRSDGIAYAAAAALGYATISALHYVASNPTAQVDIVALRIIAITAINIIPTLIIGYALSQTLFDHANVFILSGSLVIASILVGFIVAFRSSVINAPLDFTVSATRPLIAYLFSIAATVLPLAALFFLSSVSELRAKQTDST